MSVTFNQIRKAGTTISAFLGCTPIVQLKLGTGTTGTWGKCEHLQPTGSFKVRGAFNRLLQLDPKQRSAGVVAASTGNHGAAVSYAGRLLKIPVKIYAANGTSERKLSIMKNLGATIELRGRSPLEAELTARAAATNKNTTFVSPYNDRHVVAGQGTIGLELFNQMPNTDRVYMAVGGGGMVGGVGLALDELAPEIEVVGCSPVHSPVMHESVRAGRAIESDLKPTLSDGTEGHMEPDTLTLSLCSQYVDRWELVSEEEILAALKRVYQTHGILLEGAAGVALAVRLRDINRREAANGVVILCGGNVDPDLLRS